MVTEHSATTTRTAGGVRWTLEEKGQLLLALYEKALRLMDEAAVALRGGDPMAKGERLIKAQDIVLQLSDALDHGGQGAALAANLERLYLYVYRRLIRANNHQDLEALAQARRVLVPLHAAWKQVVAEGRGLPALPARL